MFGMGQFDSLEELVEHFKCMPVLGSESGLFSLFPIFSPCLIHTRIFLYKKPVTGPGIDSFLILFRF